MAINGINNTNVPLDNYKNYTPIGKTPQAKETTKNPFLEDKTINNRNAALNKTPTENRTITNTTDKPANTTNTNVVNNTENANKPTPGLQKDQQQNMNFINSVQKSPNGMDAVAQAVIQGYKGVNRFA